MKTRSSARNTNKKENSQELGRRGSKDASKKQVMHSIFFLFL
jgi:hypothetical protein